MMFEALITKYWAALVGAITLIIFGVRTEGGMRWNRREINRLEKQRDEDLHRHEQQRNEDLRAASESRSDVSKSLRTIEQDIKTILGSLK